MTLPHLRVDPTAFRPTVSESPALLQRSACGHSKLWALYQALAVSPEAGRLSNLLLSACTAHAPPPASVRPPLSPPTHSGQKWGRANRKRAKKKTYGIRCGRREGKHAADDAGAAEPAEGGRPAGPALRPDARQPPAHPPRRPRTYARTNASGRPAPVLLRKHGAHPKP